MGNNWEVCGLPTVRAGSCAVHQRFHDVGEGIYHSGRYARDDYADNRVEAVRGRQQIRRRLVVYHDPVGDGGNPAVYDGGESVGVSSEFVLWHN